MRNYTASYMCTTQCPCPNSLNTDLYDCTTLAANNRTKVTCGITPNTFVNGTFYQPLVRQNDTLGNTSYTKFWDCYTYLSNQYKNQSTTSNSKYQTTVNTISDGMQTLISDLESQFACNGICTKGAFYYFKDVAEGPPTSNCLTALKTVFNNKPIAVGVILLITCFLTFFAVCTAYGICYSKEKKY